MIVLGIVAAKLAELDERVAMVKQHRLAQPSDYASSPASRDLVAFNLMLAVQSAADLATHLIADEHLKPARTVAEAFERVAQHGVIPAELAQRMQRAVGLRNVVAHGYARLNLELLHAAAQHGVDDLTQYATLFARWAEEHSAPA